jgi:hypothetical protein
MSARTIPEPTNDEYSTALQGLITQAEAHSVAWKERNKNL